VEPLGTGRHDFADGGNTELTSRRLLRHTLDDEGAPFRYLFADWKEILEGR
jgi:hypothetical protein